MGDEIQKLPSGPSNVPYSDWSEGGDTAVVGLGIRVGVGARVGVSDGEAVGFAVGVDVGGVFSC